MSENGHILRVFGRFLFVQNPKKMTIFGVFPWCSNYS